MPLSKSRGENTDDDYFQYTFEHKNVLIVYIREDRRNLLHDPLRKQASNKQAQLRRSITFL